MRRLTEHPVIAIALIAALFGAVIMLSSALSKRGRLAPRWVVAALVLSPACFLVWTALSFYVLLGGSSLTQQAQTLITYVKTAIGTFGAGILVALFMSGQLTKHAPPKV